MSVEIHPNTPELPDPAAAERARLAAVTGVPQPRFGAPVPTSSALAGGLVRGPERWGWEFALPDPPVPFPMEGYPQWQEPLAPDLRDLDDRYQRARARRVAWLCLAVPLLMLATLFFVVDVVSLSVEPTRAFLLYFAGGAAIGKMWFDEHRPRSARQKLTAGHEARRSGLYRNFLGVKARWDQRIAQHDSAELHRVATAPLLHPCGPSAHASRVDVFGGTPVGWAALLTTMGTSSIAADGPILVLDLGGHGLPGQGVSGPLERVAAEAGVPVGSASMPASLYEPWLLGDLSPKELADVLASAIGAMRTKSERVSLQSLDAELIRTVARRLEAPPSFARLAAGVRVLRSTYDVDDGLLSAGEIERLTGQIDLVGTSERAKDELQFVGNQLDLLSEIGHGERAAGASSVSGLWPRRGLVVLRNDEREDLRQDFVDRLLFHAVAHRLKTSGTGGQGFTMIVAGADGLGRSNLESMAKAAFAAHVRLVYLFEHLREDAAELLGGGDSVTLLMRMGNDKESATASEFVGKGYSFQPSQVNRSVSTTDTRGGSSGSTQQEGGSKSVTHGGGTGTNYGGQIGSSWSAARDGGPGGTESRSWGRSYNNSWSEALTDSWGASWQTGSNWSNSDAVSNGMVLQRSYEAIVEPSHFQQLDATTFVLVDTGPQGRRVTLVDCFPGTVLAERVGRYALPR